MSEHKIKRHNKTLLLYHIVLPIKYRQKVITQKVGESMKEICFGISERYEINFIEIGYESDHVHFLVQSVPSMSVSEITMKLKSITGRQIFERHPEIKAMLWGGHFWTSGYYVNTVGQYTNEEVIRKYVEGQGKSGEYEKIYEGQLTLFDTSGLAPG